MGVCRQENEERFKELKGLLEEGPGWNLGGD